MSEAVSKEIIVDNYRVRFKETEIHEAINKELEMRDVNDNNGSRGFTNVLI